MSRLNVLVYSSAGVSAASLAHTLTFLRAFLSTTYDIQPVTPRTLLSAPWQASCALLVFPGGRDLPWVHDLGGEANRKIREWVSLGGRYLGICAGAYFASSRVEFELGTPLEVVGHRELEFFPGTCRGTVFPGFSYSSEAGARVVSLSVDRRAFKEHWVGSPTSVKVWYNGGGAFIIEEGQISHGVTVLGRYEGEERVEGLVAGVLCQVGEGKAVLWATHPESPLPSSASPSDEEARQQLLRTTLALLDLNVSPLPTSPPELSAIYVTSCEAGSMKYLFEELRKRSRAGNEVGAISDRVDKFFVYAEGDQILPFPPQPSIGEDMPPPPPQPTNLVLCRSGLPHASLTPLFHISNYFDSLPSASSFGKLLMYGEVVTSTQTLLDKNDLLLSHLPSGTLFLASHQTAGRGRGTNSWVSPAGCLQFSLVVRLPLSAASKIVFVQYLFGLAVIEAFRAWCGTKDGGKRLGGMVRLKWPNDIYADFGTASTARSGKNEGAEQQSEGEIWSKRYKKIGGILVNSSFAGGEFTIVIGCGINTSNPLPTTSLNELIDLVNSSVPAASIPLPKIRQEELVALVVGQFSSMWNGFCADGFAGCGAEGEESFMDRYLRNWIHTDQKVTLASSSQLVRIVGITPEHGLLRTVLVDVDRAGKEVYGGGGQAKFVDLMPDGNGFDMMAGLIVSKST